MQKSELAQQLQSALSQHFNKSLQLSDLKLLTGGSAAQTWRFELSDGDSHKTTILRLDHGGEQFPLGIDKVTEARVQSYAARNGVLAPDIIYSLQPQDGLGEGAVIEFISGESIPQKILRDDSYALARHNLTTQCAQQLANIHQLPIEPLSFLPTLGAEEQLSCLYQLYQSYGQIIPVFDYAFRWLSQHIPPTTALSLVHGDFRNGNLLVNHSGLAGVLDWELAHLGDPMEDLGWICVNSWRFGYTDKEVGGFGKRDQLYSAYSAFSGNKVNPDYVHYWEILGVLKWGVIAQYQLQVHLDGTERNVNRAAIGRRVSETTIDILDLLRGGAQ